jgi:hypothetical protein
MASPTQHNGGCMALSARQHEVSRLYSMYLNHQITWAEAKRLLAEWDARNQ